MGILHWDFMFKAILIILKDGFANTIKLTLVTFVLSSLIGLIVALIKIEKVPVLSPLSHLYTSFFKGTPLMVQILVFYYGIPLVLNTFNDRYGWNMNVNDIPAIIFMYIVFSLCYGAYISEVMRAAILSVDKGQSEAGYTIGMSKFTTFRRIIFPQALSNALPNLGNYFVDLVKGTSLAFTATVLEILAAAKILGGREYKYFESYLAAAIIYWVICTLFQLLFNKVEKISRRHERSEN